MRRPLRSVESRSATPRRRFHWLVAGLAVLLLPACVHAHEIGTTQVIANLARDGTYAIAITTDAGALLARLEQARKHVRSSPTSVAAYQRGFDTLCDEVVNHLALTFDGAVSAPRASCVVDQANNDSAETLRALGVTVTLRGAMPPGAQTLRWRYDLTFASYALKVTAGDDGAAETLWLEGGDESKPVSLSDIAPPPRSALAQTYFALGFTHIVPLGPDHILFVLGIFLLSRRVKEILWQVSAFTLAHTITLGLGLYGLVTLKPSIVEPLIALSIVYVAVENLMTSRLGPRRVLLVFAFGLLHGLGFAGALREMSLPRSEFLTGLLSFNAGVEAGQLAVIATALLVTSRLVRGSDVYRRLVVVPGSAIIASAGLLWTLQRLA